MKLLALTMTILATSTVHAQPAARAETLFRDGTQAMAAGKIEEACSAFEGSQRIDPNISTLINLADCREKNQQLATAWSLFVQAVSEAQREPEFADLLALSRKRAAQLEPRLSRLSINVPKRSRVDGLVVTRNGIPVERAEWDREIPVDAGDIVIEANASGYQPWTSHVTVNVAWDNRSITVAPVKAVTVTADVPGEGDEAEEIEGLAPLPFMTRRRIVALSLGGVGLAALGGGLGFEVSARSTYAASLTEPNRERQTNLYEAARARRYVAGGFAVVGVGAAVAATYLWFTGRESSTENAVVMPVVSDSQVGVAIGGGF
jgi:hypothetical protein